MTAYEVYTPYGETIAVLANRAERDAYMTMTERYSRWLRPADRKPGQDVWQARNGDRIIAVPASVAESIAPVRRAGSAWETAAGR